MSCVIAPGSPHTYSQLRAEKAKKCVNNVHKEIVKCDIVPPPEARLNHEHPEVQNMISSTTTTATTITTHKKRKRSTDELSLVISIKRSKLAPIQIEPGRLKLKKKKKKLHSPESYKISISRQLLNHNMKLPSSTIQSSKDKVVAVNDVADEPVKKVKKHKRDKDRKLMLPVQGLCMSV